jgi:hypothetical protein
LRYCLVPTLSADCKAQEGELIGKEHF